jgi:sulfur transfer protein SufE
MFIKQNVNPSNKKTVDCAIRSIAFATRQTWEKVYDDLCAIGRRLHTMPNAKESTEAYLLSLGATRHKPPKRPNGTRMTAGEVAATVKGLAVLQVANHFTAAGEGAIVDTWDCSRKCVYNYYTFPK